MLPQDSDHLGFARQQVKKTLITDNLIYHCVSQGILLKLHNCCENNIVADIIAPSRGHYLAVREGPLKMKDGCQGENHKDFSQEDIRFTTKKGQLYAFVLALPSKDILIQTLGSNGPLDREIKRISMLGSDQDLRWSRSEDALTIQCLRVFPCQHVAGFAITLKYARFPFNSIKLTINNLPRLGKSGETTMKTMALMCMSMQ